MNKSADWKGDRVTPTDLLEELAGSVPTLRGARCRGHSELFDKTIGGKRGQHKITLDARSAALDLCATCPALDACRDWIDALPAEERPLGVTAGQVIKPSRRPAASNRRAELADRCAALQRTGLSLREIAAATGSSASTVRRALTRPKGN